MTLGQKTVILFLLLGLGFTAGNNLALDQIVSQTFTQFERENSESAMARATRVLEDNMRSLQIFAIEYAAWDHTYDYVQGRRPEYAEENLDPEYWQSIDINMFLVFDAQGQLVFGSFDNFTDDGNTSLEEEIRKPLAAGHPLVTHQSIDDFVHGFLQTQSGLMQVASYPILTTEGAGPIAGTVVVGQLLHEQRVIQLGKRATAEVTFSPAAGKDAPARIADIVQEILSSGETRHFETAESSTLNYRLIRDVLGAPVAVLEVITPRDISRIGLDTVRTATTFLGIACAVFLLAAWMFIQRLIVAPVKLLTEEMLGIRDAGDIRMDFEANRSDEVGVLAGEFRKLTSRLKEAQQQSELARQDSEKARDEAIAMSRTKSEFLARMSHEIRTPMNGVLGMTELLQDTPLNTRQQRFAQTIYESAESLLRIINDILDFSKMEAGRLQLELLDVDLHELLEETIEGLASQAHRKGVELINVAPGDLRTTVQTDPGRLRQVLTNLVSNAIKFTEKGEVILRTTVTDDATDEVKVLFEVEDTGIGIRPEKQQDIFDSFAQEDGSTTRLYGGTGLGLAICKQIVELMGGNLGLVSTPGSGSTFSFAIHMQKGRVPRIAGPVKPRYIAGNKVLIVDDNATNREILEHQLSGWRAQTDTAESAAEALTLVDAALASGEPYDLAILDMHMPHTDGVGLARAIRGKAEVAELKIIVLSSVATPAPEDVLKDLGIAGQLTKPIRQSQLYDALIVVLGGEQVADTHSSPRVASIKALAGRVLLAEDNPVNQAVAIGMLEALGLTVIVAPNGRDALEKSTAARFDAILMDCQMPGMDGFQATEAIRSMEAASHRLETPIIAVTANALKGDRERCLQVGMNDYITKPFTSEQLHSVLSTFLQTSDAASLVDSDRPPEIGVPIDTPPQDASPIDGDVLDVLARLQKPGTPSIVQKVVHIYLDSSRELKNRLQVAIETTNAALLRESAHALKSSSANVGAHGLADLCKRLEIMGREDNLSDAPTVHDRFEREYARVVAALMLEIGPVEA